MSIANTRGAAAVFASLPLLLLAGCEPMVADYENPGGSGGTPSAGGEASTSTGGRSSNAGGGSDATGGQTSTEASGGNDGDGGGVSSGGGSVTDTGGQGGEAGEDDFPWPDLPDERGVVASFEPWDMSGAGCCSRVPGSEPSDYCLPGTEARLVQVIPPNNGVVVGTTFDLQTDNGPVVVALNSEIPVRIGVMETELVPPERIIDMSPVYWIGGEEDDLPEHFMALLQGPDYGVTINHPDEQQPQLYYSADGTEFEPVDQPGPLRFSAYLDKSGFVVLGAGPDTMQCQLD